MRTHLLVLVGSTFLISSVPSGAEAQPRQAEGRRGAAWTGTPGSIRRDRLSRKALETWSSIVAIVMAEGAGGRPLHPTLLALWDAVDSGGCAVFVELPEPKSRRPYILGRFAITKVDSEGRAREGVPVMNLPAIDRAASGPGAARENGFTPFAGLGKKERYAEVLGHELAHAAWSFADADRTRLAMTLPGEVAQLSRRVLAARVEGVSEETLEHARDLERLSREVEEPAEAAEESIQAELLAGQRAR
jgi:hypothetical protein